MLLWTSDLQNVVHKAAPKALIFQNVNAENNLEKYYLFIVFGVKNLTIFLLKLQILNLRPQNNSNNGFTFKEKPTRHLDLMPACWKH